MMMSRKLWIVIALFSLPISAQSDVMPYEYRATIINVVDGDTIDAVVELGFKITTTQRIRLARVDTPEKNQPRFEEAKKHTAALIGGKQVKLRTVKMSKWGYYLGEITIDGKNISDSLIAAGLAKPYDGGTK